MPHTADDDILELAEQIREMVKDDDDYTAQGNETTGAGHADGAAEATFRLTTRDGNRLKVTVGLDRDRR